VTVLARQGAGDRQRSMVDGYDVVLVPRCTRHSALYQLSAIL